MLWPPGETIRKWRFLRRINKYYREAEGDHGHREIAATVRYYLEEPWLDKLCSPYPEPHQRTMRTAFACAITFFILSGMRSILDGKGVDKAERVMVDVLGSQTWSDVPNHVAIWERTKRAMPTTFEIVPWSMSFQGGHLSSDDLPSLGPLIDVHHCSGLSEFGEKHDSGSYLKLCLHMSGQVSVYEAVGRVIAGSWLKRGFI